MKDSNKRFNRLFRIISAFIIFYWRAFLKQKGDKEKNEEKRAILLRETLEKLGSVFIKFGQLFALRPDFLPLPYCRELFYLLENVPPFSYEEVVKIFREEFGTTPERLFKKFNQSPLAAASFGQVHEAYLKTGEKVAVKIQRPHIKEIVYRDITLMKLLVKIIDIFPLGPNKLSPIVNEFEQWTKEELDYLAEADYTEAFYEKTNNKPDSIAAPLVYRKYCSHKILTTQFIEGISLSSILLAIKNKDSQLLIKIKRFEFSKEEVAMKLLKKSLKQIYIEGYFHADPHPANIIFTQDKNLVYVDFGIVGKLNRVERISCLRYIRSVLYGDINNSFDALLHICDMSKVKNLTGFKNEHDVLVKKTLDLFYEGKNKGVPQIIGKKLIESLRLLQKYNAIVPPDTLRYFRTIVTLESIVLSLNPQIELDSMAEKFRNISIVNLINELPNLLSSTTFNERLIKWLNIIEKEILKSDFV